MPGAGEIPEFEIARGMNGGSGGGAFEAAERGDEVASCAAGGATGDHFGLETFMFCRGVPGEPKIGLLAGRTTERFCSRGVNGGTGGAALEAATCTPFVGEGAALGDAVMLPGPNSPPPTFGDALAIDEAGRFVGVGLDSKAARRPATPRSWRGEVLTLPFGLGFGVMFGVFGVVLLNTDSRSVFTVLYR